MQQFARVEKTRRASSVSLAVKIWALMGCLLIPNWVHASVTELAEKLRGLLGQVPKPPGSTGQDKERRLLLNGQVFHVVTGHSERSVRETLEFYRTKLEDQAKAPTLGLRTLGFHQISEESGFLLLVDPLSQSALKAVAAQEELFTSAGPLRMVTAVRRAHGADYLVAWTDEPLRVESLSPSDDLDAPGRDVPGVPRPIGSVRGLSLFEPAAGYGLITYQLPGSPESSLRAARDALRSAGFQEDPDLRTATADRDNPLTQLLSGKQSVLVKARARRSSGSQVTYLWRTQ